MATGTQNFADEARRRKVDALVRAAEWTATNKADEGDTDLWLETLIERLAGRLGQDVAIASWNGLRCIAHELSGGVNYGHPSDLTQAAVIGHLMRGIATRAFYDENPDKVFAELGLA